MEETEIVKCISDEVTERLELACDCVRCVMATSEFRARMTNVMRSYIIHVCQSLVDDIRIYDDLSENHYSGLNAIRMTANLSLEEVPDLLTKLQAANVKQDKTA